MRRVFHQDQAAALSLPDMRASNSRTALTTWNANGTANKKRQRIAAATRDVARKASVIGRTLPGSVFAIVANCQRRTACRNW